VKWLGLRVKRHDVAADGTASVAFVARYKIAGRAYRLEEDSHFLHEAGRWYYVTGNVR
jgi:SEC-C motif-containing protein